MSEENREAIERVRAYGQMLKGGAPHQIPIGADILRLCDLASHPAVIVPAAPLQSDNSLHEITERGKEIERLTKTTELLREDVAKLVAANDSLSKELGAANDELVELKKVAGAVSAGPTQAQLKKRTKKLDDKDAPAS